MPENPGVTPSPSIAKCWYWVGSENGLREQPPPSRREILSLTPGTSLSQSIYLASQGRISNSNLCDLGAGYCQ